MLSPRAIALQGVGYVPQVLALQGFWVDEAPVPPPPLGSVGGGPGGGGLDRWSQKHLSTELDRTYNLAYLKRQDREITEFLVTLVTKGFFNGQ